MTANPSRRRPADPVAVATLRPMLAARATEPFDSPNWVYELLWGGVRALAVVDHGRVALRGQNGVDLTAIYPELVGLAAQVQADTAVLDGEIVALSTEGKPNLELLRPRLDQLLNHAAAGRSTAPLSYQVSDLLELDGRLLLNLPLWQRRNLLHVHFTPNDSAQVSGIVENDGVLFYRAVAENGLGGVVAKRRDSFYYPGERTDEWLEVPAAEVSSFVIGGYTFGGGQKREPFEALLLGAYQDGRLRYAGRATAGIASAEGWRTLRLLQALHSPECPFDGGPPEANRFIHWCRPQLVCQVRLGERGPDGLPRFATFVALRPDLPPEDCQFSFA